MKKTIFLWLALLPCMAWAQFDQYFTESSLRVDYCLTGNSTVTSFSLKELIHEPYWSGSKTNLIDTLEFGNYIVKVFEAGTDKLLFSKGYQNLYGEWQTTDEAKQVTKTFEESVIVPFPKVKIDIALFRKTWEGELVEGMRLTVNPDDYFIRNYDNLNLPVYAAWIGNRDITKAVDIVILPEGYTQAEMGKFIKDCDFFVKSLFNYEPYDRYRESFNVRGVMVPSEESGCTMPGDKIYKNTAMRFSFWTFDSERYCMSTDNRDIRDLLHEHRQSRHPRPCRTSALRPDLYPRQHREIRRWRHLQLLLLQREQQQQVLRCHHPRVWSWFRWPC